jgi:hypothetical protein
MVHSVLCAITVVVASLAATTGQTSNDAWLSPQSAMSPPLLTTTDAGTSTLMTGSNGATLSTGPDGTVMTTTATADQQKPALPPSLLSALEPQPLPAGEWHMKPVRAVHARVQSDAPILHATKKLFVSRLGQDDFETGYNAGMDGVNTASVEGALMYVQAEGINYNARAEAERCERKNRMKYIVFYEVVVAQTNETLALYQDTADQNEYGPMVPLDQGRCSPTGTRAGQDVLPKECYYFNGDQGEPNVGPFVGGGSKADDVRAPYPDNVWFSFPNTCPLKVWADKTPECRASTRKGLCAFGELPDGIHCTFAYSILGFIPIDDVVGITSMVSNTTGQPYKDFEAFCKDGGVEFKASQDGEWEESLAFWQKPQDDATNAERARHLIESYQNLTSGNAGSSQIDPSVVMYMRPLPAVESLASENPPCYENVKKCSGDGSVACRRETYSQVCRVCESTSSGSGGCEVAPRGFKFPVLKKAVGDDGNQGDADPAAPKRVGPVASKKPKKTPTSLGGRVEGIQRVVLLLSMAVVLVAWC